MKAAGYTYMDIGIHTGMSGGTIQTYLRTKSGTGKQRHVLGRCSQCKQVRPSLHRHHTNYETNEFKKLCSRCHARLHCGKPLKTRTASNRDIAFFNFMGAKLRVDRRGQFYNPDLLPPTPMEQAQIDILTKAYHKTKGNISLTARTVGWSRTKTLKKLKAYKLHDLYPHDPGPIPKEK